MFTSVTAAIRELDREKAEIGQLRETIEDRNRELEARWSSAIAEAEATRTEALKEIEEALSLISQLLGSGGTVPSFPVFQTVSCGNGDVKEAVSKALEEAKKFHSSAIEGLLKGQEKQIQERVEQAVLSFKGTIDELTQKCSDLEGKLS